MTQFCPQTQGPRGEGGERPEPAFCLWGPWVPREWAWPKRVLGGVPGPGSGGKAAVGCSGLAADAPGCPGCGSGCVCLRLPESSRWAGPGGKFQTHDQEGHSWAAVMALSLS